MRMFSFSSLKNKLTTLLTVAAVVPLATIAWWSFHQAQNALMASDQDMLKAVAAERTSRVQQYFDNAAQECSIFAQEEHLCETIAPLNGGEANAEIQGKALALLKERQGEKGRLVEVLVTNATGHVLLTTANAGSSVLPSDLAADPFFAQAQKSTAIKDTFRSATAQQDFLAVGAPLFGTGKERPFLGILIFVHVMDDINEIAHSRVGMGETGETYLVNQKGLLITESRHEGNLAAGKVVNSMPVTEFQKNGKIMFGRYLDMSGIDVLGVSEIVTVDKNAGISWLLLAEVDYAETVQPARKLALEILVAGGVMAALATFLGYWMARGIARRLGDAVAVLNDSTVAIAASVAQSAASSTETAAAVNETTATAEEVKQTTQMACEKAKAMATNADRAIQDVSAGRAATAATAAGMERIRAQMGLVAESIMRLNERNQAIASIISTVDDIAEQSNLLAVNAAIEAARAGDHGKGFGVVAQEIRTLASQSKQATEQVRRILSDIQKATGTAVMATEQGTKTVEDGGLQVTRAEQCIEALNGSVADAAQGSLQIAASSHQQLMGMSQVAQAMENIKQASMQNVSSMNQLKSAAVDLQELGTRLKLLIG